MAAALHLFLLIGKFLGPQLKQLCDADDETRRLKDFLARYNSHFGKDQVGFEIAVISEEALSPLLTHSYAVLSAEKHTRHAEPSAWNRAHLINFHFNYLNCTPVRCHKNELCITACSTVVSLSVVVFIQEIE